MKTAIAATISERIRRRPAGTFFRPDDFEGSRAAVYTALNRAVDRGDLKRLRNGLYYKGRKTPYGMAGPRTVDLGLEMAGPGAGPAGLTAAQFLGLTTQNPVVAEIAVPMRNPAPIQGVHFTSRPPRRLALKLNLYETALIEFLRMWPKGIEADSQVVTDVIEDLVRGGAVSVPKVERALQTEHVPRAREAWELLKPVSLQSVAA